MTNRYWLVRYCGRASRQYKGEHSKSIFP